MVREDILYGKTVGRLMEPATATTKPYIPLFVDIQGISPEGALTGEPLVSPWTGDPLLPLPVAGQTVTQSAPLTADEKKFLQLHPESVSSSHSMFDLENISQDALFWLTMLLLGSKDPKAVRDVLVTMFGGISKSLESYCRAGVANRITAWGSGRLLSLYMERLGMLTQPQAIAYSDGLTILSGASIAESYASIVMPWKFTSEDTQFPDQVTLAETGSPIITSGGSSRTVTRTIGSAKPIAKK